MRVLTAAERVEVAKDVLKQLKGGKLRVKSYHYMSGYTPSVEEMKGDLRDIADKVAEACKVCGLGAMVLSAARLYDGMPLGEMSEGGVSLGEMTSSVWGKVLGSDGREIEKAFEGWADAMVWRVEYPKDKERLGAIMKAYVKAGGEWEKVVKPVVEVA